MQPRVRWEKTALLLSAKSLAMTVYDYLTQAELRQSAADDFAAAV